MGARFPFSSYPEGWYRVAWSRDLPTGKVLPLRWFGQELVLYRGETGRAYLQDAFCPHLGGHLGHGGRVKGEAIECPFHGWRMANGRCVLVPLAKKIPPRARVRMWPICEQSGVILAYHSATGEAPRWVPDPIETWMDPKWTRAVVLPKWRIRTHVQEIGENAMDISHLGVVHEDMQRGANTVSVASEGPILRLESAHHYRVFQLIEWLGREVHGTTTTTCDGFGRIVLRSRVAAGLEIEYSLVFYPTPVDEEWIELHGAIAMRRHGSWLTTKLLFAKAIREARKTVDKDVPILEHKRFEERPLLVEGEQALGHFRRWSKQFYAVAERPLVAAAAQ